jgi:hypothetical protein
MVEQYLERWNGNLISSQIFKNSNNTLFGQQKVLVHPISKISELRSS